MVDYKKELEILEREFYKEKYALHVKFHQDVVQKIIEERILASEPWTLCSG